MEKLRGNNKIVFFVLVMVVLLSSFAFLNKSGEENGNMLFGLFGKGGNENVHKISAKEAKTMMDSGDEIIIVDVRTKGEYDEGHVPNAILVPNETIGNSEIKGLPLDATILVYCRSGARSSQAAGKLAKIGYENIYDFGGIMSWPYDVVR